MRLCYCAVQLTLIGSVLLGVRDAEADWFWQNPWPQGNDLRAVAVPDAATVFAVSGGLVLKSTDGGGTWTIQNVRPSGSNLGLADISCVDANTCMAVGSDGGIRNRRRHRPEDRRWLGYLEHNQAIVRAVHPLARRLLCRRSDVRGSGYGVHP